VKINVEKYVGVASNPCVVGDRPVKKQDQAAYWSSLWDYRLQARGKMAAKILTTLKLDGVKVVCGEGSFE